MPPKVFEPILDFLSYICPQKIEIVYMTLFLNHVLDFVFSSITLVLGKISSSNKKETIVNFIWKQNLFTK